jgi:hypothetical protein
MSIEEVDAWLASEDNNEEKFTRDGNAIVLHPNSGDYFFPLQIDNKPYSVSAGHFCDNKKEVTDDIVAKTNLKEAQTVAELLLALRQSFWSNYNL